MSKWEKFKIRLITCYLILTGRYRHWILLNVDEYNLVQLVKEEHFDAEITYHGIQYYNALVMLQMVANSHDEIDLIFKKADYQNDFEAWKTQKDKI